MNRTGMLTAVVILFSSTIAMALEVLKSDPPNGSLLTGTSVLVDDSSCPKGQIKKLTRVGPMTNAGFRKSECVAYRK